MTDQASRRWIAVFSRKRADAIVITGPPREVFAAYGHASFAELPADVDVTNLKPADLIRLKDRLDAKRWSERKFDDEGA